MNDYIDPRRAPWRMLTLGLHGLGPLRRTRLAPKNRHRPRQNRGDNTVVHLSFVTGGKGRRVAGEL
jgi:hypothetical protein